MRINLEQFIQEIAQDVSFQKQLRQASPGTNLITIMVEFGRGKGYNYTEKEVELFLDACILARARSPKESQW